MKKPRILITCGPTREPIDPVRFLSNHSTGVMGIEIAKAALRKKLKVTLAHGPIDVPRTLKVKKIPFETTRDVIRIMHREVKKHDIVFMTAAVSDFHIRKPQRAKIKKRKKKLSLSLVENEDVLKSLIPHAGHAVMVGFSVESHSVGRKAYQKLLDKELDLIVAQRVSFGDRPFGPKALRAWVIERGGKTRHFKKVSKSALSEYLLQEALELARDTTVRTAGLMRGKTGDGVTYQRDVR